MRTPRLELVAARLEHLDAELESPVRLKNLIGAEVLPSWPPGEYDRHAIGYFRDRLNEGGEAVVPWYVWYAIQPAAAGSPAILVACGGYFGPPSPDGTVEVGYSVVRSGAATVMQPNWCKHSRSVPSTRRACAEFSRRRPWTMSLRSGSSVVAAFAKWEQVASRTTIDFSSIAPDILRSEEARERHRMEDAVRCM